MKNIPLSGMNINQYSMMFLVLLGLLVLIGTFLLGPAVLLLGR